MKTTSSTATHHLGLHTRPRKARHGRRRGQERRARAGGVKKARRAAAALAAAAAAAAEDDDDDGKTAAATETRILARKSIAPAERAATARAPKAMTVSGRGGGGGGTCACASAPAAFAFAAAFASLPFFLLILAWRETMFRSSYLACSLSLSQRTR